MKLGAQVKSNREVDGVKYHHVDNVKIYEFLDEIYSLPFNNQIYQFESVEEIIKYLKEQWAGLFEKAYPVVPSNQDVESARWTGAGGHI